MLPHITQAHHIDGYIVSMQFSDSSVGTVDLSAELIGPMFEPLRDVDVFAQVRLHPELHTLVWPNGADLAPEFLRSRLPAAA